ncbi:hypothetical protein PFISCL1PPCAC_2170, partial [Pristionchus fissidentatus]
DELKAYLTDSTSIKRFFCPAMKNSTSELQYQKLLLSFFFGERILHPKDIEQFIKYFAVHYPNLAANTVVDLSTNCKDEHQISSILHSTHKGLTVDHTGQLRQIIENCPGAAIQNSAFITRIFDEKHAIVTEEKHLGSQVDAALEKYFKLEKNVKRS